MLPSTPLRVLVVDGDADSAGSLRGLLEERGFAVRTAGEGRTADVLLRAWHPDVVLLELALPDMDGVAMLRRIKALDEARIVIIVTAHATVAATVESLTSGAMSLVEKPVEADMLLNLLARVRHHRHASAALLDGSTVEQLGGLISREPVMRTLFQTIRTAAPTDVNVLILGESGTGKELVAGAIHHLSPRADRPFIKVNCAAIPPELLESELFGHVRGSFTSAFSDKKGLFEEAHGGSILLDEIGDMPVALQVKLLRVLQDREFRPVGASRSVKADFRLICATNADPHKAMADGRLRQDLFFRLNTIAIQIPSLRQRQRDLPLLAAHFLEKWATAYERPVAGFDEAALARLERYAWPGNVRELEHAVERAVILAKGPSIGVGDLPESVRLGELPEAEGFSLPSGGTLEELERLAIMQTLERTSWNKRATATILGIHRPTLYNKLRKYGLWRGEDRFRKNGHDSRSVG